MPAAFQVETDDDVGPSGPSEGPPSRALADLTVAGFAAIPPSAALRAEALGLADRDAALYAEVLAAASALMTINLRDAPEDPRHARAAALSARAVAARARAEGA